MRQSLVLAGLVAFVSASPAPEMMRRQNLNFDAVNAAPAPQYVGPPAGATYQDIDYNTAKVNASGAAAATAVAMASATAAPAQKKRGWCGGSWCGSPAPTTSQWAPPPAPTTSKAPAPIPTTTSSTTTSAPAAASPPASSDDCAVQPDGYGPKVVPDTPAAFLAYPPFHVDADTAVTPSGYTETFKDLNASVNANTYLGLTTFKTYDVQQCATLCNQKDLCTAFNIYIERDPSVNPAAACPDPPSITNYKCTLWGSDVDTATAVNDGQYRDNFHVVITASNGYSQTATSPPTPPPMTPPGWQHPTQCGNGSVTYNSPSTCMGNHFFPGPYNPLLCAAYATAQNAVNVKSSLWSQWFALFGYNYNSLRVTFFDSYMLKKNGIPIGTYCSLYAEILLCSSATFSIGEQDGCLWGIESSWSYSIDAQVSGY